MRKRKIIIDFSKVRDNDLNEKSDHILKSMDGNPNFTTPKPELNKVREAAKNYSEALANAQDGSKEDTAIKNQKREELEDLLSALGRYVQDTAEGDEVKMLSSGFDLSKQPEPVGALPAPKVFQVEMGENAGELAVTQSANGKADGYIVQYAEEKIPANESDWREKVSSRHTVVLRGLKSGVRYFLRGAAFGSSAELNFCDSISRVAQ